MKVVELAIVADANVEAGLHVTLHSALASLAPTSTLSAHLFLKDFDAARLATLRATVAAFGERCRLQVHDAGGIDAGAGRGLLGSRMPYLLFRVPELVEADRIVCLDADLLIRTDLTELYEWDLSGQPVAMVRASYVHQCWPRERDFLVRLGVPPEVPYYNSGVVLMDLRAWRGRDLTGRCFRFVQEHAEELSTADQTVINAVAWKETATLPDRFNIPSYPQRPVPGIPREPAIYHFIGRPKPWDFLGGLLHLSHGAFAAQLAQTSLRPGWRDRWAQAGPTLRLWKSYLKVTKARLTGDVGGS